MFRGLPEQTVARHLPLVGHVEPGNAVLLSDGSVMAMFSIAGQHTETADAEDINGWHAQLNHVLRQVADDTVILTVYHCRGAADRGTYPEAMVGPAYARGLDSRYRDRLFAGMLYSNQIFLAVQVRPRQHAGETIGRQISKRRREAEEPQAVRVDRLKALCALLAENLRSYRPVRLGVAQRRGVLFSEIGEALAVALTGIWRPVPLTTGRLGSSLLSERLVFGREAIELRGPGRSHFSAIFGLREYPDQTFPGMLNSLATSAYRATLCQTFRFVSKADAHGIMTRKQNRMAAGDKAKSQMAELDLAADDLASNRMVMGDHHLAYMVFADSMPALSNVVNAAWRDLADCGAVVTRETLALQAAYLSMVPGNAHLRVRPGLISSRNFAALAALHAYPQGDAVGRWGAPIALLRTTAGTPYRFHWHVGDVGNALVTGETGSGKSLLVGWLLAQTAGRARVVALDHKRGWELLIRTLGGDYAVLGAGKPHLAPLKALSADPRDLDFLSDLLRGCIMADGRGELSAEEDRLLAIALRTLMSMPREVRSLSEVRAFLGESPDGAGARLEKWCWGGELGWVIDAPEDTIDVSSPLCGLDTTALLENPRARAPALLYLFHRIERQLDGRPLLIPTDEGWRALLDPVFRSMIDKRLRTIRSRGGAIVFITQSPRDIIDSGIAPTLIEQCPTQIHMPNPRATEADYIDGLKRTAGEFATLKQLTVGSGRFLLCRGAESLVAELNLQGMEDDIAVLSGRDSTVRLLDRVRADGGDEDPMDTLRRFTRARLEEEIV